MRKADARIEIRRPSGRLLWGALALVALIAITFVAYVPAFRAGFVWDDDMYVTDNPALRSVDGLRQIWLVPGGVAQYYPLAYTTFWVEYQLWGLKPVGYHAVNVALHAVNAVLAWLVFRRLGLRAAWFAAAIFAVHPVHVESVTWVTERKNVLSGLFYLLTALAYARFRPFDAKPVKARGSHWGAYVLALLTFLAALLSKTATCSLPAALLLLIWWKRTRLTWRDVWPTIPLFALAAGLSLVTYLMEAHHVGAEGPQWAFSLPERFLIAGRALCLYAAKLLWPLSLAYVYPRWTVDVHAWWQYLYPAAVVALGGGLWWARRRIGKGPLTAVLFYAGTLFPVLGFVSYYYMRYSLIADHFQYLPSLGLIALVAEVAAAGLRKIIPARKWGSAIPGAALLLMLSILTWRQSQLYESIEVLWRDTLAKNPASAMANNNLGLLLRKQGRNLDAVPFLEAALRAYPNDVEYLCNLGNTYTDVGRFDDAQRMYTTALTIDPVDSLSRSGLASMYVRHARQLVSAGQAGDAIAQYRECLKLQPDRVDVLNGLAWLLATAADPAARSGTEAVALAQHARDLTMSQEPAVLDTLAAALAEAGQFERALDVAHAALNRARQLGADALIGEIGQRIELYADRTPYHAPPAP